jgi:hypothetical protein
MIGTWHPAWDFIIVLLVWAGLIAFWARGGKK